MVTGLQSANLGQKIFGCLNGEPARKRKPLYRLQILLCLYCGLQTENDWPRMWIHGQPASSSMKQPTGSRLRIGSALNPGFIMNIVLEATKLFTKSEPTSLRPSTFHGQMSLATIDESSQVFSTHFFFISFSRISCISRFGKFLNSTSKNSKLAAALLDWFAAHARDLPWRRTRDPYAIWGSKIML